MAVQYATKDQIEANLKGFDADEANVHVTPAILTDFIEEESQVIDQHIQAFNTLPVVDAEALIFLRKICISLVIYRVAKTLMPREQKKLPNGDVIQDIAHSSEFRIAMNMLKDLKKGITALPNTDPEAKVFSSSFQVDDNTEKNFELDKTQW